MNQYLVIVNNPANLFFSAGSRVTQISSQPVTSSEQDVVQILLAQQQVSISEIKMKPNAWPSNLYFTITAESSRAHWLIFIVNKRTDT